MENTGDVLFFAGVWQPRPWKGLRLVGEDVLEDVLFLKVLG